MFVCVLVRVCVGVDVYVFVYTFLCVWLCVCSAVRVCLRDCVRVCVRHLKFDIYLSLACARKKQSHSHIHTYQKQSSSMNVCATKGASLHGRQQRGGVRERAHARLLRTKTYQHQKRSSSTNSFVRSLAMLLRWPSLRLLPMHLAAAHCRRDLYSLCVKDPQHAQQQPKKNQNM